MPWHELQYGGINAINGHIVKFWAVVIFSFNCINICFRFFFFVSRVTNVTELLNKQELKITQDSKGKQIQKRKKSESKSCRQNKLYDPFRHAHSLVKRDRLVICLPWAAILSAMRFQVLGIISTPLIPTPCIKLMIFLVSCSNLQLVISWLRLKLLQIYAQIEKM